MWQSCCFMSLASFKNQIRKTTCDVKKLLRLQAVCSVYVSLHFTFSFAYWRQKAIWNEYYNSTAISKGHTVMLFWICSLSHPIFSSLNMFFGILTLKERRNLELNVRKKTRDLFSIDFMLCLGNFVWIEKTVSWSMPHNTLLRIKTCSTKFPINKLFLFVTHFVIFIRVRPYKESHSYILFG